MIYFLLLFMFVSSCSKGVDEISQPSPDPMSYVFPDDFNHNLVGKKITIKNEMYVTATYKTSMSGNVTLSSEILRIPTDEVLPGSGAYKKRMEANWENRLLLVSGDIKLTNIEENTLRVGAVMKNLVGTVSISGGRYALTVTEKPDIVGNERPGIPEVGKYNMKVVSMNLEYYMASPSMWGHSNGAKDEAAFKRQQAKILAAMKELDADVYAICEIEEGNYSAYELTQAFNEANGVVGKYKKVDSGDKKVTSYTKNVFIYNSEKVVPYKDFKIYDGNYLRLRHVSQCFELKENGGKVVLTMNHFKAKSGNNAIAQDKDQGDGQSQFNARRVQEAKDCLATYESLKTYYGDEDVLILGDLNSYSMEDPVKVFIDAGYTNELQKYSPDKWSYVYQGEAGYLDHSLSSSTLTGQITGAAPWDINASEPGSFKYKYTDYYQPDPYRYSDHNPIVTGLKLEK